MPVLIDKAQIIAILRSDGRDATADWVDRELPALVDTRKNSALLQTLNIDLTTMVPVEAEVAVPQG